MELRKMPIVVALILVINTTTLFMYFRQITIEETNAHHDGLVISPNQGYATSQTPLESQLTFEIKNHSEES